MIAGPTAVGKTAVAVEVARHFGTEIISADSRQCYKELKIGVARPSGEELSAVKQHFIATHSIHQKITAADFESYGLQVADTIFKEHPIAVITGGTGLYLKAFAEGLDHIPEVPEAIRSEISEAYRTKGISWLQQELSLADPRFFSVGEIKNPHRMMRALEVHRFTGRSILDFRKGEKVQRNFRVLKIALELPRPELNHRIGLRVDQMMQQGLEAEVRSLLPFQHLNALQTVGYRELFDYFNGQSTLTQAVEDIKTNTRQYAKRQMTWFRKDKEFSWLPPSAEAVIALVKERESMPRS